MNKLFICLFPICLSVTRCNPRETREKTLDVVTQKKLMQAQAVAGNFSDQTDLFFDSTSVANFLAAYPDFSIYKNDFEKFYRRRRYAYAWYDDRGLIEQASSLFNRINHLKEEDGLDTTLPYEKSFQAFMEDRDSVLRRQPRNPHAELMLTAQYFSFARHVWQGLPQKETQKLDWFLQRKELDLDQLMDSLLRPGNKYLEQHEPVYRQYTLLKTFLKRYEEIKSSGGWESITAEKKVFQKGDSSVTIKKIRRRFAMTEDYKGDTASIHFTEDLENAVRDFQNRYGLKADGLVNSPLLRELNVPVDELIEKITVNMERARWVPESHAGDYLVVNIPAYKLYLYRRDSLLWDMNVVAGKPMSQTVIFNGDLKYVVFSPYWNVPPSIMRDQVLPGMKNDPRYLEKHNMEQVGNVVRQKPGPNNSLGRVKFLFPNSYSIYLHDTPAKNLFKETSRAFSHGCIRLAEPKKLAMYLLRNNPEWTEQKIDLAMHSGVEKYVTLKETVPVFIAYFTAWVDRNGKLNVRPDIYNNDHRLAAMILAEK